MMRRHSQPGFTLIELMTAVSIFFIILSFSMRALFTVFDANRKSQSMRTVMTNLNLSMETLSREMRYGTKYHCGFGDITEPQNCANGGYLVSFLSSESQQITYRLNGSTFEKQVGNGDWLPIIAAEVVIDHLAFYVTGAGPGDGLQPKALITFKGHAGSGETQTTFGIETLVSQRTPDS